MFDGGADGDAAPRATTRCSRARACSRRDDAKYRERWQQSPLALRCCSCRPPRALTRTPSIRARPAARAGHPLRAGRRRAAAPERRQLGRAADPRLRRQRLPRRRVPLPGLPLRRQRRDRQPGPERPALLRATRSRARPGPTPTRPTRCTRTTPPTSSSCASSRSPTRPRSGSRSTRSRTASVWSARRSRSAARRDCRGRGPHGANVSSPAQLFLTVHGSTAGAARRRHRPAGRQARRRRRAST